MIRSTLAYWFFGIVRFGYTCRFFDAKFRWAVCPVMSNVRQTCLARWRLSLYQRAMDGVTPFESVRSIGDCPMIGTRDNPEKQFSGASHTPIAYHTGVIRTFSIPQDYEKRK